MAQSSVSCRSAACMSSSACRPAPDRQYLDATDELYQRTTAETAACVYLFVNRDIWDIRNVHKLKRQRNRFLCYGRQLVSLAPGR